MPSVEGRATRGTTGTNRLRRVDRWIACHDALRRSTDALVADLGFGASPVTTLELAARLRRARPDVLVHGVEIDPERVAAARAGLAAVRAGASPFAADLPVAFARGGFELPLPGGRRAAVIRAFNVLRQYDEGEVAAVWRRLAGRLAPGGVLVEGTCDELGRIASWADVGADGEPRRLTVSLRLAGLDRPGVVAERLPKALIHRNVPGERVHAFLAALDAEWDRAAPLSAFGPVQRWIAAAAALRRDGWPIEGGERRWRLGELTVAWDAVRPAG